MRRAGGAANGSEGAGASESWRLPRAWPGGARAACDRRGRVSRPAWGRSFLPHQQGTSEPERFLLGLRVVAPVHVRLQFCLESGKVSAEDHRQRGEDRIEALTCVVITVSDTRTLETDESGKEIVHELVKAGHDVIERTIVPDEPSRIDLVLRHWLKADVQAVILNGGTGISPRDGTVEVVRQLLDRELEGFGELFRMLSFDQVGAAAMLSRALGGIAQGKVVFALPGSRKAVALALEKLIVPELRHIAYEVTK